MKKYIVELSEEERGHLKEIIRKGKGGAAKQLHARILLKVDSGEYGESWTDEETSDALEVSIDTVERVRERLVEEGLEAALNRKKHSRSRPRKLDGKGEAQLVKLACSKAPEGRTRWTLRLLAGEMIELAHVDTISYETIRQTLKKTN